jgi:hypothetical protein
MEMKVLDFLVQYAYTWAWESLVNHIRDLILREEVSEFGISFPNYLLICNSILTHLSISTNLPQYVEANAIFTSFPVHC